MIRSDPVPRPAHVGVYLSVLVFGATGCGTVAGSTVGYAAQGFSSSSELPYVAQRTISLSSSRNRRARSWNSSKKGERLIYISRATGESVDIFDQGRGHKMVGQIQPGADPGAITVDDKGNLYVVVGSGGVYGSSIYEYAPGATQPSRVIPDHSPGGLAVDHKGLLAAINYFAYGESGPGDVEFFQPGSTTACRVVEGSSSVSFPSGGGTFDSSGNLYIIAGSPGATSSSVGEVRGGCRAKSIVNTGLGGFTSPYIQDVKFDSSGNLDVLAPGAVYGDPPDALDVFAPGSNTPSSTVPILGRFGGTPSPKSFAFTSSGKDFWLSSAGTGSAEYHYPTGGQWFSQIAQGSTYPDEVAIFPPLEP